MKKPVWEVDKSGEIVEHLLYSDEEIERALLDGRSIIDFPWVESFFRPVFDFTTDKWIEGNTAGMLNRIREMKKSEMKIMCDTTILGRFYSRVQGELYEFSYDEPAQSRFNGVGLLFQKGSIKSIGWTAYLDGQRTRLTLTTEDFDMVSMSALFHCENNVIKYNDILKEIDEAGDVDSINAIKWGE